MTDAERELELCRHQFNRAGERHHQALAELDASTEELIRAAQAHARADEAVRHGGYAPGPDWIERP